MTFHEKGFRSLGAMGVPANDSSAGSARQLHSYVTNDDRAAVETSNYFDALLDPRRVKIGDLLLVSYDVDGTPGFRSYVVNIVSSHVVPVPEQGDDAGASARAVVPTSDGLTTGLIYDTDKMVVATSAGANNILCLPPATAKTRGREIAIWVVPSTNCELQTHRGSSDTINNVNCGGGAVEALLTHTQFYIARQHLDNGWLLQAFTALGAVATAIVPD
jgi:hypothetical protein